jgi:hypothetical protein
MTTIDQRYAAIQREQAWSSLDRATLFVRFYRLLKREHIAHNGLVAGYRRRSKFWTQAGEGLAASAQPTERVILRDAAQAGFRATT